MLYLILLYLFLLYLIPYCSLECYTWVQFLVITDSVIPHSVITISYFARTGSNLKICISNLEPDTSLRCGEHEAHESAVSNGAIFFSLLAIALHQRKGNVQLIIGMYIGSFWVNASTLRIMVRTWCDILPCTTPQGHGRLILVCLVLPAPRRRRGWACGQGIGSVRCGRYLEIKIPLSRS